MGFFHPKNAFCFPFLFHHLSLFFALFSGFLLSIFHHRSRNLPDSARFCPKFGEIPAFRFTFSSFLGKKKNLKFYFYSFLILRRFSFLRAILPVSSRLLFFNYFFFFFLHFYPSLGLGPSVRSPAPGGIGGKNGDFGPAKKNHHRRSPPGAERKRTQKIREKGEKFITHPPTHCKHTFFVKST